MSADATALDLTQPQYYINRELSLLQFNRRVLEQACDPDTPLLERLRFLCISSSNLDEFFEIRVGRLKQFLTHGIRHIGPDGMSAQQVLDQIQITAHEMVEQQYRTLNERLVPMLAEHGIRFVRRTHWDTEQAQWLENYFENEIRPVLSPVVLDPAHPFPPVINKSLNFIVALEGQDAFGREIDLAILPAPRSLPRVIRFPSSVSGAEYDFAFLSSIIHRYAERMFPGMRVNGCYQFRLTRNSNLFIDEEEASDLLRTLQGELLARNYGNSVRLEVADNCPREIADYLLEKFNLTSADLYEVNGPVNLNRLIAVPDLVDRADLRYKEFSPGNPLAPAARRRVFSLFRPGPKKEEEPKDIFSILQKRDILLHMPFQSFMPVIDLVRQAARDPQVLAIKQTLYRTDRGSLMVEALIAAARAGKDVTVVVEIKARFDEEANIQLATRMQEAGVQVVYGVVGHKTHAKMLLVVRRERHGLRSYVHLGTGNYHAGTAKVYTDYGLLTSHPEIARDVQTIFLQLTSMGRFAELERLLQAPFTLHSGIIERIHRETELAHAGRPARILAKMNSLHEREVIQALYEASQAGVQIDLVVRGVCALRPGMPGISDNIRVRSIVGRFLEHHRIFYFGNDGNSELYLSSADWLERNFFRRVETGFPIDDAKMRETILEDGLELYLRDNVNAWELDAEGNYHRPTRTDPPISAQNELLSRYSNLGN